MTNQIYLAGIVERAGRLLLIRPTPSGDWELPGGPLLQRHPDADQAMGEILETFGIKVPSIADGFVETLYLPEGDGHIVYNIYSAIDWTGEPEIPIGMGAGWYSFEEMEAISMRDEVRNAVLVAYGLREPVNQDAAILQAMAGAATDPGRLQPPLSPLPPLEPLPGTESSESAWRRPTDAAIAETEAPSATGEAKTGATGDDEKTNVIKFPSPELEHAASVAETVDPAAAVLDPPAQIETKVEVEPEIAEPEVQAEEPADPPAAAIEEEDELVLDFTTPAANLESEPVAAPATPTRRELGYDILRTLGGGTDPEAGHRGLRSRTPEIADDIVDFALGEVWSSPRLDRKTRSLEVVAMLSALGGRSGPLRSHINGALNHGASADEVVETLRMVAVYAGFPAALEAWNVMEEVFKARGVQPEGRT